MRRCALFLAALAMALQSLWPLIAQARPRAAGELVPVCSVGGITHSLELPAVKTPLEQRSSSHGEHCKLCVFGVEKVFAFQAVSLSVCEFKPEKIKPATAGAPEPSIPSSAQPRAPPAVS